MNYIRTHHGFLSLKKYILINPMKVKIFIIFTFMLLF